MYRSFPGSPGEYGGVKSKPQDVASKSLSGLESLVDQIPSIAEGGAGAGAGGPPPDSGPPAAPAGPALPDYAAPAALYPPYGAYGAPTYPNNGYDFAFNRLSISKTTRVYVSIAIDGGGDGGGHLEQTCYRYYDFELKWK